MIVFHVSSYLGKGSPPGVHFQIRQSPAAQQLGHLPPPWAWAPPSSASSRRLPRLPTGDRCKKRQDLQVSPILVGRGLRGRHTCLGRHLIGQIHMLKSQKVMIYHTLSYIIILSMLSVQESKLETFSTALHHTSEDELELFFLFFPITGGSTKHVHRPPPKRAPSASFIQTANEAMTIH